MTPAAPCTTGPLLDRDPLEEQHLRTRPGDLVAGRYRVLRLLGRGGMGAVWLALDRVLGRSVAIKETMPARTIPGAGDEGLPLREARATCVVSHPGVVQVYDFVDDGERQWIVMEALSGRSLEATVREQRRLSVAHAVELGLRLLEALQAVHGCGVVHGDIKPSNIQLVAPGQPVLLDFGLATSWGLPGPFDAGTFVGSPAHTAPEVIRTGIRSQASDLFALGSTLYYAVEGRHAFQAPDPVATAVAVLSDCPTARHGAPLGHVIDGLLAKEPSRRLTAREAHSRLQGVESDLAWRACAAGSTSC